MDYKDYPVGMRCFINGSGDLAMDKDDAKLIGNHCVIVKLTKSGLYQVALMNDPDYVRSIPKRNIEVPDYGKLFEQAIYHLRVLSGSRNSFTSEARERLYDPVRPDVALRTPELESMHREAFLFLKQHDK